MRNSMYYSAHERGVHSIDPNTTQASLAGNHRQQNNRTEIHNKELDNLHVMELTNRIELLEN